MILRNLDEFIMKNGLIEIKNFSKFNIKINLDYAIF
jgi:hypothetical protein